SADPDLDGPGLPATTRRKYDPNGRVTEEIDPRGTIRKYEYDALGRLRFEKTTLSDIVDDGDHGFGPFDANDVIPADASGDGYGGDFRLVQKAAIDNGAPPYANAVWTFENLPAGTYRIATTWTPDPTLSDWLTPQWSIDGVAYTAPTFSLHERTAPND